MRRNPGNFADKSANNSIKVRLEMWINPLMVMATQADEDANVNADEKAGVATDWLLCQVACHF